MTPALDASAADEGKGGVEVSTPSLMRLSSQRDREELFEKVVHTHCVSLGVLVSVIYLQSTDRADGLRHRG